MILAGQQEFKSKHILQGGGKCRSLSVPRLHDSRPWLSFWSSLGACAFCALQRHRHVPGFVGRFSPENIAPQGQRTRPIAPPTTKPSFYIICAGADACLEAMFLMRPGELQVILGALPLLSKVSRPCLRKAVVAVLHAAQPLCLSSVGKEESRPFAEHTAGQRVGISAMHHRKGWVFGDDGCSAARSAFPAPIFSP